MTEDKTNPNDDSDIPENITIIDMAHIKVMNNQDAWALIAVPEEKYTEYKNVIESGEAINLYDYGEVLAHKVGAKKPTPEEEKNLTEKFGYVPNLNIEKHIDDAIDQTIKNLKTDP